MIRLTCPGCERRLEIDDGFAGGICRCYDCGTLMTVPADAASEAEQLEQVERSARPERPDTPGVPAPAAAEGEPSVTTLVTRTGREIQVSNDQLQRVAVAHKPRLGVRAAVVAVFVVLALGLITAAAYLASDVLKPPGGQTGGSGGQVTMDDLLFGMTSNPYLSRDENLITMPVDLAAGEKIVVVVEGGKEMDQYMHHVRDILAENLATLGPQVLQAVIVGREVLSYPDAAKPAFEWEVPALEQVVNQATGARRAELAGAVSGVVKGMDRVVFVAHREPEALAALREAVPQGVRVDVVQLGRTSGDLKDWAESTGGRYAAAKEDQLDKWRDQWQQVRGQRDVR